MDLKKANEFLSVNDNGHLTFEELDTVELAKKYGTPLYLMSENSIKSNIKNYLDAIEESFGKRGHVAYACKAFCCKEMARLADNQGLWLDVVSSGELYTALSADFPAERIIFHGNNKSNDELKLAVDNSVGRIVVDNEYELERLINIAETTGKVQKIQIRLKPGVDPDTHQYVRTGGINSKFGISLSDGTIDRIVRTANQCKAVKLVGIHCHIGSQILDYSVYFDAVDVMVKIISDINQNHNLSLEELNLGGGLGIYYKNDETPNIRDFVNDIHSSLVKSEQKYGIKIPAIYFEPGRSIVGNAGITLYKVGAIKKEEGLTSYLSVDGGMADNPRYALYKSKYSIILANKADKTEMEKFTVAGKCCESGDLLQEDVLIADAVPGDILAVLSTGAYNYSMSSNYNRIPRPPVVMINKDTSRIIVKRESLEDIIRNDI
ncbi:MAG: diaminopimelate decarboxylase [Ruminococcaceae bacterium]|nr:diaminopimelate decarboxylase [Oscillospiraceae bacterium]